MRQIKKKITYFVSALKADLGLKSQVSPRILSYLITNICNSHCITCNAWKCKEIKHIDKNFLQHSLKSTLFSKIRHVGISGGEPSTFNNLEEHINIILNVLSKIESLSITSNCILSDYWKEHLPNIQKMCTQQNVHFQLNISLDGIKNIHDKIRGTKNNFSNTEQVIDFVKKHNIPYQLHTTIDKYNVYHVGAILHYAKSQNADIIFRLASEISRLNNKEQLERVSLNKREISFLCDFLQSEDVQNYTKSPGRKLYYRSLVKQLLRGTGRIAPCYFKQQGIVLSSDGALSYCSRFDKDFGNLYDNADLLDIYDNRDNFDLCCNGACQNCYHDQTGLWPLHSVLAMMMGTKLRKIKKTAQVIEFLFKGTTVSSHKEDKQAIDVKSMSIVGMYGGEHVGDAAILGGVIKRLKSRYVGLENVYVYSFREDRTQCWIDCLNYVNKDIRIEVTDCLEDFKQKIKESQLIVWGGGPLMELPVVLSRNYMLINYAISCGCHFEMEGIGYGPINTFFGRHLADRIIKLADRITLRSVNSIKDEILKEKYKEGDHDPAFDYLKDIPLSLTTVCSTEKRAIDKLCIINKGQKIMMLNLRPLWSRYGKDSAFCFDDFLSDMANTIIQLHSKGIITVFFPMNADQFGFSDLTVGYHLQDLIGDKADFRIWETEPSIDSLIYLLRKADFTICMRFHAVIFSLSQKIKTIGLDYSLNGKGKVSGLFAGDKTNYLSILEYSTEEIINKVDNILNDNTNITSKI